MPRRANHLRVPRTQDRKRLSYTEARSRLYSLEHWGIRLGLRNIEEFCSVLGNPQSRFPSIHIAGTNGKGSTSAFLDSILRAAGYCTGRYTSPHLRDFRERIHIDGHPISPRWIVEFVETHWDRIIDNRYTYFEVSTALAFAAFARAGVDLAVVEVGLGGRFDATNVVDPMLCIITRIARDHEQVLGQTPQEIAFEKAGIIKTGVPILLGPLMHEAEERIRQVADERGAPIWAASEILTTPSARSVLPTRAEPWRTALRGSHQLTNLAIATAAAIVADSQGIKIPRRAFAQGVQKARWPARFQIDHGSPSVIYDAAHNPDGARAIAATWREVFGAKACVCVFNTRPDKKYTEMIGALSPIVTEWIACPMPDSPFVSLEDLSVSIPGTARRWRWADSPARAMNAARRLAGPSGIVLATGSHYLVGAVIPPHLLRDKTSGLGVSALVTSSQLVAASQDRGAAF